MALTITRSKRNSVDGSRITAYRTVAFDNSYPAGGEAFDANAEARPLEEFANAFDATDITALELIIKGTRS